MNTEEFDVQVAGHGSILVGVKEGTLCKPLNSREFMFYYLTNKYYKQFKPIICEFHGIQHVSDGKVGSSDIEEVAEMYKNHWNQKSENNPVLFIEIEDLTYKMKKPCVMDIKLGRQEHDQWATDKKKAYLMGKCALSTSVEHSIRYCGMFAWKTDPSSEGGYTKVKEDKSYGRTIGIEAVKGKITTFFDEAGEMKRNLIDSAVEKLRVMEKIYREQDGFIIYSSSVLFVYDVEDPTYIRVKQIDFAHAIESRVSSEVKTKGVDKDLVDGIVNLISILEEASCE